MTSAQGALISACGCDGLVVTLALGGPRSHAPSLTLRKPGEQLALQALGPSHLRIKGDRSVCKLALSSET